MCVASLLVACGHALRSFALPTTTDHRHRTPCVHSCRSSWSGGRQGIEYFVPSGLDVVGVTHGQHSDNWACHLGRHDLAMLSVEDGC